MKINSLKMINFRNYSNVFLEFSDNLNIIYGNNGIGKTNLVEAIYTLALSKSFRTNNDRHLIKKDEVSTKIEGVVVTNSTNNYQIIINEEGKKVKIDGDIVARISDYISNINVVLLEPDEQMIFKSSPSARRKMLNIEISQLKKDYVLYINNYNKILKQRNFYLRELYINGNRSVEYLDILTKKLVEYGYKVYNFRKDFINKINEQINTYYHKIFELGDLRVKYISDYNNKTPEDILKNYQKNYNKEIIMGKTLNGIHHDDLEFILDSKDISEWGSNGQQKNAIFAYKLAEIEIIKEEKGLYPILILDDLFSALDNEKIKNIVKLLDNNIQTFITTTELDRINDNLFKNARCFNVLESEIRKANYERE